MAKAKGKAVAASDVPTNVEETTGIDANAESDPLESVMEEETTMVVDESEKGDNKEEIEDTGKVESVGTDVPEDEMMDGEDKAGEVKATEDTEADGKGGKPSEGSNTDEKVDSIGTDVPEGEKMDKEDKAEEVKATEDIEADEKGEKPTEDINANEKGESASNKKANKIGKRKRKQKKSVVNGLKAATSNEKTTEPAAEKKEAVAEKEVLNEKSSEKVTDTNQRGASAAEKKNTKKADGMGLIFMCNAKTKKDCFNYKVLGLPASKKGLVEKVYKGMRLFLFDIDLKLMYGIYKATSPGGYNLEPKAFKSAFPSQVRFTVLKDCLPLPEEKFKAAIKGNYTGRNKFNCKLSAEQVRNLCKLFMSSGKASFSKKPREAIRAETRPSDQEPRRRPRRDRGREVHRGRDMDRRERPREVRRERSREDHRGREMGRRERPREDRRERSRVDYRGRERQDRHGRSREDHVDLRISGHDLYSRRGTYPSPPPRTVALPPPLPPPSYAYERLMDDYYYRRDPLPSLELRRDPLPSIELRDPRVMDVDMRPREPVEYRDPYALYREPLQFRESGYPLSSLPPSAYPPLYPRY